MITTGVAQAGAPCQICVCRVGQSSVSSSASVRGVGGRVVAVELSDPRVLVCGSRRWPWPGTVEAVLDRLAARHGEQLVVIEGAARGRIRRRTCGANVTACRRTVTGVTRSTGVLSGRPARGSGGWPARNATLACCCRTGRSWSSASTTILTPPRAGRRTWPCAASSEMFPSGWCPAKILPPAAGYPWICSLTSGPAGSAGSSTQLPGLIDVVPSWLSAGQGIFLGSRNSPECLTIGRCDFPRAAARWPGSGGRVRI